MSGSLEAAYIERIKLGKNSKSFCFFNSSQKSGLVGGWEKALHMGKAL